jgi:heme exporter protein D
MNNQPFYVWIQLALAAIVAILTIYLTVKRVIDSRQ